MSTSDRIPGDQWQWFGKPGHFICSFDCRFHMCTLIGDYLISTVGEYFPSESAREIFAKSRGVVLQGRGDAREAQYLREVGFQELGPGRTYETMVFLAGPLCNAEGCECGMPTLVDGRELEVGSYNTAGDATRGHMKLCEEWATHQGEGIDER